MFAMMRACFGWLPLPLRLVVGAIFSIFALIIAIEVIKIIAALLKFLVDLCGGIIAKVVAFFV